MHKTKRRDFLKAGVGAAVALASPVALKVCRGSAKATSPEINAQVAAIAGDNLDAMTRDAIDALGGIRTFVSKGQTVFIKPNFVSIPWAKYNKCFHAGECTKTEIIIAVMGNHRQH